MEENEKLENRDTATDQEALRRRRRRAMLKKKRQRQIQRTIALMTAAGVLLVFLVAYLIIRSVDGRGKQDAGQDGPQASAAEQTENASAEQTEESTSAEQTVSADSGSAEQTAGTSAEQAGSTSTEQPTGTQAEQASGTSAEQPSGTTPEQTGQMQEPADAPATETPWAPSDADPGSEEQIDVMSETEAEAQAGGTEATAGTEAAAGGTTTAAAGTTVAASSPNAAAGGPGAEPTVSEEVASFHEGYAFARTDATEYLESEAVQSSYALIVDVDTGTIVAGREYDVEINPASMTKILTLLVAVEHLTDSQIANMDSETFTITEDIFKRAYYNDSSVVGWYPDDEPTLEDLLYGTILPSGADASVGLAEYTAGSEETFVGWMNDKLKELGLSETAHFTNCIGLYDEDHYCTLTDMAAIMKAAIENDLCREVLSAHTYTTSPTENAPDGIALSNWFLRRIEDKETNGEVVGAKTGFVNESGNCAASYQVSDSGGHYICVTANAWSAWRCIYDHVEIYTTYTE